MSDMDRILKLAGLATTNVAEETVNECECDCGESPCKACGKDHHEANESRDLKDGVDEAVGSFAEPIYDLIDEYGVENVIDDLIRYMSGDDVEEFVADFRRHNDQDVEEAELSEEELAEAIPYMYKLHKDGKSHEEIAKELKMSVKAVKDAMSKTDEAINEGWCAICLQSPCACEEDTIAEGGHKDEIIDDAQSMDLEDFCDKHEGYGMDREECVAQWKYINGVKESSLEEGRMSDQLIHDAENMSREEFEKKHGKEAAKDMFDESVEISEAPTMDTTQLITLLKNAGLTEEAIEEKLTEWANTPEGVGEVEPTEHGDAYEMAQSVNLSLKRYLDAEDAKVQVSEHKVEDMKALYEAKKNK